tara:strand:- start:76 stop:507 length:432 start_codon:yes stop_codon:yes gene_type:complete
MRFASAPRKPNKPTGGNLIKFTKLQAELLADRPPDCIADALSQTYDWDFDFLNEKASHLSWCIDIKKEITDELDNYDLEILADMINGNTIMQGLADAAEFEEITKKEFGNYKRAFKSVIKKLNKIGEGHESFPIDPDNGMLYL